VNSGADGAFIDNLVLPLAGTINGSPAFAIKLSRQAGSISTVDLLGQANQQYIIQASSTWLTGRTSRPTSSSTVSCNCRPASVTMPSGSIAPSRLRNPAPPPGLNMSKTGSRRRSARGLPFGITEPRVDFPVLARIFPNAQHPTGWSAGL